MTLNRLLRADYVDPDRRRRAEALNLLLVMIGSISFVAAMATGVLAATGVYDLAEAQVILAASIFLLSVSIGVFWLNRRHPVAASIVLLVVLTAVLAMSDYPEEMADGRGWLLLVLPVVIAASVLSPWTAFLFAGLVSLVVIGFQIAYGIVVGIFAPFAYLVVATVVYVGARRLQLALTDLRAINRELDQRVVARTQDLTEANAQLAEANERLRELDRLKSQFLSMVSHELRTPLSAIQGFCEIILAEIYGPLTDGQKNALNRITENSERLLHLVSDILDQARIEAGALRIECRPYAPSDEIQKAVSTLHVLAVQTVALEVDTLWAPALVYGDPNRFNQIVTNLVSNALKFTQEGSVTVTAVAAGEEFQVRVADTGPGIPEEAMGNLFERFRQVEEMTTRRHGGTGLGLAISQQLAELMGGTITVESEVGVGSTFTVILPIDGADGDADGDGKHASATPEV